MNDSALDMRIANNRNDGRRSARTGCARNAEPFNESAATRRKHRRELEQHQLHCELTKLDGEQSKDISRRWIGRRDAQQQRDQSEFDEYRERELPLFVERRFPDAHAGNVQRSVRERSGMRTQEGRESVSRSSDASRCRSAFVPERECMEINVHQWHAMPPSSRRSIGGRKTSVSGAEAKPEFVHTRLRRKIGLVQRHTRNREN